MWFLILFSSKYNQVCAFNEKNEKIILAQAERCPIDFVQRSVQLSTEKYAMKEVISEADAPVNKFRKIYRM